ncbi:hypothetical protein ACFQY0_20160 [Haloferula chungangensis]|uniref:HEAT repeat domain-containing protein n=1 Tax=Haloferula chungangensis TaxID=1048331 RepID=A0ABW2LAN5_9BACT
MRPNRKTSLLLILASLILGVGALLWLSGRTAQPENQVTVVEDPTVFQGSDPDFEEPLSEDVQVLTGRESVGFNARMDALRSLSRNLEGRDLQVVLDFIGVNKTKDCSPGQWYGLQDSVLTALRRQNRPPEGLTPALVALYRESGNVTLQDYAVQHMRSWYGDRGSFDKHEKDPVRQRLLLDALIDAGGRRDQSYCGTALMALHSFDTSPVLATDELVKEQMADHLVNLDSRILEAARESDTQKLCRISALQLCAMRGIREILPVARVLASDDAADINLRISAIAVLGKMGSLTEDAAFLRRVQQRNRRLSFAAGPALERLGNTEPHGG